jgi:excinuclease ABC subunit C
MYGVVNYIVVRGGKVIGSENYPVNEAGSAQDILSSYIVQFYEKNPIIANEVLLSTKLLFETELKNYLSAKKGSAVVVTTPKTGSKFELVKMASKNAKEHLDNSIIKITNKETLTKIAAEKLKEALCINADLKRVECYDISNISGVDKVASMVVFINGEPAKEMYRRFKIKTVAGIDDFACMKEVITRRVAEFSSNDTSFSDHPNLVVIDGGKGQLSSVCDILLSHGINVIGLAKREEEVFTPHATSPIILERNSPELSLLQRIRDEAHRFAVTYHRILRRERQTKSNLINIPGIGKNRARALLTHFKRIENIIVASVEDICMVSGFSESIAKSVYEHFTKEREIMRGNK